MYFLRASEPLGARLLEPVVRCDQGPHDDSFGLRM